MLETKTDTKIQSNLGGTVVAMGIDENSLSKLMRMLSGLYSDTEMAIIREYATNALDSHIEAGVSDPIRVTLPTDLSPFLTIQDFGTGMDLETIKNVYSKYGASTKTNTNSQTGMLGVGCKSALAYTDQFTLVGVKGGMRYHVVISRDEYGSGSMTVMDPEPTDERNGVTIQIPIKRHNQIAYKCQQLFKYWQPGTVLVNDKEPEYIQGDYITKKLLIVPDGVDRLVMGGVPYPVVFSHGLNSAGLVAFADIGDVDFVPSREALDYSTRTKDAIAAIDEKFIVSITRAVQKDIDSQPTLLAALLTSLKWREKLGRGRAASATLKYKGNEIPLRYEAPPVLDDKGDVVGYENFTVSKANTMKVSQNSKERTVAASWMTDALIVYGYELSFTPAHKKKMEIYAKETVGFDPSYFIMCKDKPKGAEWLDSSRFVHYGVIKEIKLPQYRKAHENRVKGSYKVQVDWSIVENVEASDLQQLPDLYYQVTNGVTVPRRAEERLRVLAQKILPGQSVVLIPSNRVDKFKRDFPNAVMILDALSAEYAKRVRSVSMEVFEAKYIQEHFSTSYVRHLEEMVKRYGEFKDPEIKRIIDAFQVDVTPAKRLRGFQGFDLYLTAPEIPVVKWKDPFDDYYLWDWGYYLKDHYEHAKLYADTAYSKIVKTARSKRNRKAKKTK